MREADAPACFTFSSTSDSGGQERDTQTNSGEVEFNLKHAFGASTVHTSGGVYEYMCEAGGSCGWKVTKIGLLSHMTGIQVANCDLYLIIFKQRNRLQVLPPTTSGPSSSCEFILKWMRSRVCCQSQSTFVLAHT